MKRTNKINKIISIGLLAICAICLNSCLKNNKYYIDYAAVGTTVEMAMAPAKVVTPPDALTYFASLGLGAYVDTINHSSSSQLVPVYVNVASPQLPGSATTATLILDTASLNLFNSAFGQVAAGYSNASGYTMVPNSDGVTYEVLPDSCYQVTSWTVTVPAGQRLAPLNVMVNPNKIDTTTIMINDPNISSTPIQMFKHNYILPISIKTASQTVSNWKTVMVNVQVQPD